MGARTIGAQVLGYEPGPDVIAEAVERAGREYERWSELVAQCGYCHKPLRLVGRVVQIDKQTGEMREAYSTAREPDNCIYVACGNRKETKCPSCSAVYKADVYHLVLEGMVGGPVVPSSVSGHPMVFATFTAPSFGAVHAHIRKGYGIEPCRKRSRLGEKCPHGVRLGCWERHREDDPRLGTPLCAECFDYEAQVLWNRLAPKLWERTMIYLPRTIARLLGMRMKDLVEVLHKPQFAKVGEYQGRGAIHFHAIVRLDGKGPEGELVTPPASCTVELLREAIIETARTVEVAPAELGGRISLRWGKEVYVRPIRRGGVDVSQEAVAAYVAKYATKGTEGLVVGGEGRNEHLRRLSETARELDACPEFARLRLAEAASDLGFRGHYSTRSRRYSTTLKAKRQVRRDWARRARLPKGTTEYLDCWGRPEDDELIEVERHWSYAGSGYRTRGEEWLALSAAARAREWRRLAREDMWLRRQHRAS